MTIKNVVVPLETEYLQEAARKRGISRTKLVRVVMEKVVKDELVLEILDDNDQVRNEPSQPKYRRFRARNAD
jgi:AAA+ superfamily predicted ATPase